MDFSFSNTAGELVLHSDYVHSTEVLDGIAQLLGVLHNSV